MEIRFYEVTDHNDQPYEPPWLAMLRAIDSLSPSDRQHGRDLASVYWRNTRRPGTGDAIIELARTRTHSPAVSDTQRARTGPAPSPGQGRVYSERVLGALVDDRVVACLRIGGGAALSTTIASHINTILDLPVHGNPIGAPMRFLRILSPQFVERLSQKDSAVAKIELHTSYGGLRRLYDSRGVLARSRKLRRRDTADRMKVDIRMGLDTKKRNIDSLSAEERLDAEALLEEALELVQEADDDVRGKITMMTPHGREPVHLGTAHLSAGVKFTTKKSYIDPLDVLGRMHQEYASLASQVRRMLR